MSELPYLSADVIERLFSPQDAVAAIVAALKAGVDPASQPARTSTPTSRGEYLIMPAEVGDVTGVKVLTVAPDNPSTGRPRIQGVYVLFDAQYLHPMALLDAVAITNLRTPAVSMAAVLPALGDKISGLVKVVVFGTGPQAQGHVRTLLPFVAGAEVAYVSRTKPPLLDTFPGEATWLPSSSSDANEVAVLRARLAAADVIFCATTAREPVFNSSWVKGGIGAGDGLVTPGGAVVVAVGSHEPNARELESSLLARAQVVAEDPATAVREAGDVVQAIAEGAITAPDLISMADVVTGKHKLDTQRLTVFKSTGMAWEDLVIADAAYRRWLSSDT